MCVETYDTDILIEFVFKIPISYPNSKKDGLHLLMLMLTYLKLITLIKRI